MDVFIPEGRYTQRIVYFSCDVTADRTLLDILLQPRSTLILCGNLRILQDPILPQKKSYKTLGTRLNSHSLDKSQCPFFVVVGPLPCHFLQRFFAPVVFVELVEDGVTSA